MVDTAIQYDSEDEQYWLVVGGKSFAMTEEELRDAYNCLHAHFN